MDLRYLMLIIIIFTIFFKSYYKRKNYKKEDFNEVEKNTEEKIHNIKYKEIIEETIEKTDYVSQDNKTMMQFFEWYLKSDCKLYEQLKNEAQSLSELGIKAIWLPPPYKGVSGCNDVGYGIYDLYDLGEFNQKGSINTKYGSKKEYFRSIKKCHENGIEVYADIVFNHKAGADKCEKVMAVEVESFNRNMEVGGIKEIEAHTVFNFEGRNDKYSPYKWSAKDFTGVDYDESSKRKGIFKLAGNEWAKNVDSENGNYDFLMFADIDIYSRSV